MARYKGTELNNVNETWQQNERLRERGESRIDTANNRSTATNEDLDQTIREEAAAYDEANKEDRVLGGDRATVNDDENAG